MVSGGFGPLEQVRWDGDSDDDDDNNDYDSTQNR